MTTRYLYSLLTLLVLAGAILFGGRFFTDKGNGFEQTKGTTEITRIKVVYFDFYKQSVVFKSNGKTLLKEVLDVTEPTTGLAKIDFYDLEKTNLFELYIDERRIETAITLSPNIKMLYIHPNEPYITTSASDVVLLD